MNLDLKNICQQAAQKRARLGEPCSRCQIFDTTSPNCLEIITTEKALYCDVGVRSVLRQLRQQLKASLSARGLHLETAFIDVTEKDQ